MKVISKYRIKGFTMVEILIVMALTSIAVATSFSTLTYVQRILARYKQENRFVSEYTDLKQRLYSETLSAVSITEDRPNFFTINRDSGTVILELTGSKIFIKNKNLCDTFHIEAKNINKEYEYIANPLWKNRLLRSIFFDAKFSNQTFTISFTKIYDSTVKLRFEETE